MALDTTVAGADADAYLSVAEADAIATQRVGDPSWVTAWAALTEAVKENAIRQATVDVDLYVRATDPWTAASFQPLPLPTAQRLAFPRTIDYTGTAPGTPHIPVEVQRATVEQAIHLVVNGKQLDQAAIRRARGMFSFSEEDGPSGTLAIDPTLGYYSSRMIQLLRALIGTCTAGVRSVPIRSLAYRSPTGLLG